MNIIDFPMSEATALRCPHGNDVWWGHECGDCEQTGFYGFLGEYLLDVDDDVVEVVEHLDDDGYVKVKIVEDTCGRCQVGDFYEVYPPDIREYDGRPVGGVVPVGAATQYKMTTPVPTFDSIQAAEEWLAKHAH